MFFPKTETVLLWFFSFSIALASYRIFAQPFELVFADMTYHLEARALAIYGHIIISPITLMIVPFQISKRFRSKHLKLHRYMGRIYGLGVLLGGISGLYLGLNSNDGWFNQSGFSLLAILWMFTTAMAISHARGGRIAQHRKWMIRSIALTLAAVTLRILLGGQVAAGVPFETAYQALGWACWVPNLLVAEWFLRRE